jgi:hypothetical protein
MYFIPLIMILLIALAIFFSPIFAVLLMIIFLLGLGAYKFLARGTEPERAPVSEAPLGEAPATGERQESGGGAWGEKWPEQRQGEQPSS